jgi:hypothetical protein
MILRMGSSTLASTGEDFLNLQPIREMKIDSEQSDLLPPCTGVDRIFHLAGASDRPRNG